MRKILTLILALGVLALLAACGEEEEELTTPPTFEGITVEGRDPVQGGELDPYAVDKNADITLEIQFSNPDDVEFNTVQINGTTYRAHRFSEDSTSQNLILDLNAGRLTGEETYEVEEIEYIDEEGVKSIGVSEDNAYALFVMRSTPTVEFEDLITDKESIEVELTIDDPDGTLSEARLEIVHEEDGVLDDHTQTVESGFVSHVFESLESDTTYDFRVTADYETDDPDAESDVVEDAVIGETSDVTTDTKTVPSMSIENTSHDETSYTFDVDIDDPDDVILEGSTRAEVLQEGEVCGSCDIDLSNPENITLDGLLSGTGYTINIYADYNLNDGSGERSDELFAQDTFTTDEKTLGDLEAEMRDISENSMVLDIDGRALYESVDIDTLEITAVDADSGETIRHERISGPLHTYELNDLHAGQELMVSITATYYQYAGQVEPEKKTAYEDTFTTTENSEPELTIDDVDFSADGAEVSYSTSDPDTTLIENSITLYLYEGNSDTPVAILENVEESGALVEHAIQPDETYRVEIAMDYDLRDGEGLREDVKADSPYTTTAPIGSEAPSASIRDVTLEKGSISFDVEVDDENGRIEEGSVEAVLHEDGVEITRQPLDDTGGSLTFDSLADDTEYTVDILADTDDGTDGVRAGAVLTTRAYTTPAVSPPSLSIDTVDLGERTMDLTLNVDDPYRTITGTEQSLEVLDDEGTLVAEFPDASDGFDISLTNLSADSAYTFRYLADTDYGDGAGVVRRTLMETTLKTDAYTVPQAGMTLDAITRDSVDLTATMDDPDDLGAEITSVEILRDGETIDTADEPSEGGFTFDGLYSGTAYSLKVTCEYDMRDGNGVQERTTMRTFRTDAPAKPTVSFEEWEITGSDIEVTISELSDPDSTVSGDLSLELWYEGEIQDSVTTSGDSASTHTFEDVVEDGTAYSVVVKADYDLGDENSPYEDAILDGVQLITFP